jgi:transcriptional regulator with PAS, ATPase and Fis domain
MNKISSVKDSPIQNLKEDSLQISKYAVSLSKFIEISDTPITIGLQGEWGTGKDFFNESYQGIVK